MNRLFSVRRRRPNIVDIDTPKVYGVDGYRLKWDTNFDGAFATTFLTSTNVGFLDDAVNRNVIETQPVTDKVRIVFNPATYSITDTLPFWLKFVQVIGGVEQTPGAPTLVLPDASHHGVGLVTIHGDAPSGATVANSLQIDLPMLMQDFRVHNESTARDLYLATEANGPEVMVPKSSDIQSLSFLATQGSIYVRSLGGTATFSLSFTLAFPR
jgi:hypothetical protein